MLEKKSDYIVVSLGKNKPLSNGIGGLILSDYNFISKFDIKTKQCRDSMDTILEFYYPLQINYKRMVKSANKKINYQRNNVKYYKKILSKYDFIKIIDDDGTIPSYHRFPIFVNELEYDNIINILNRCNINYQKDYKKKLNDLPVAKNKNIKVVYNNKIKQKCLLLKTNNYFLNIKKFEFEMRKYYGT